MKTAFFLSALVCLPLLASAADNGKPANKDGKPHAQKNAQGPKNGQGHKGALVVIHKLILEKYDANRNGKIDDDERQAIKADAEKLAEQRKAEIKAKHQAKLLEQYDTDKNGQLDEAESEVMKNEQEAKREARRQELLKKFDKDGDGKLSKDERPANKGKEGKGGKEGNDGKGGKGGKHQVNPAMRLLGAQLLKEKYDTNRDGKLDDTEREAIKKDAAQLREERKNNGQDTPENPSIDIDTPEEDSANDI